MEAPRCPSCGKLLITEINNEIVKCSDCLCNASWITVAEWREFQEWEKTKEELEESLKKKFRNSK
jgi:ribosomal protein L37AE/L43A